MDMNLLTALDALLEHNSVAAAAARLHLTPPAVSRTLARIRHVTGDPILVRSGRTMVATPYASSIRAKVRALVLEASTVLQPRRELDVATLDRVFTVRGHDALLAALATDLISSFRAEAPSVRLRLLGEPAADARGDLRDVIDLDVGAGVPAEPEIAHEVVGADDLVVAMRRRNPLAGALLSAAQLAAMTYLNVSRRGRLHDRVDDAFAALGLKRTVAGSLPTCVAALDVVARTDFATVVPRTVCSSVCEAFDIAVHPLPFELPPSPIVLSWHRRFGGDLAHAWMRRRVAEILGTAVRTGVGGDVP